MLRRVCCRPDWSNNRYTGPVIDESVLRISENLTIPLPEIELLPIRAQGPGGQNVNKVSSAIHLRFNIAASPSLPDKVRDQLLQLQDQRISSDGIIVLKAQSFRSQEKNRDDALRRLQNIIQYALREQKPRKTTRPSKTSVAKRLDSKTRRGRLKRSRNKPVD
jgi:ribosome-associated protein